MARAPQPGEDYTPPTADLPEGAVGIGGLVERAQQRRHYMAIGIGALVGGASYAVANKRMATNRAILVGLVLAIVAYMGARTALPPATAMNYGN
tara:strand:- start:2869 stop:3150 length:282 start_codon:yes stop_codon:yes gene_type:complete